MSEESGLGELGWRVLAFVAIGVTIGAVRSCPKPYNNFLSDDTHPNAVLFNYDKGFKLLDGEADKKDGTVPLRFAVWNEKGQAQIGRIGRTKKQIGDNTYYNYHTYKLSGEEATIALCCVDSVLWTMQEIDQENTNKAKHARKKLPDDLRLAAWKANEKTYQLENIGTFSEADRVQMGNDLSLLIQKTLNCSPHIIMPPSSIEKAVQRSR